MGAAAKVQTFRLLHVPGRPVLMPNPWDPGTAKLLASLGFQALATTSSGHAATLGRSDGSVNRDEALAHASSVVAAVEVPVSADLENGFADDPSGVFATVTDAVGVGLAGCSIEDFSGTSIYDARLAADRVAAAVAAAGGGPGWCSPRGRRTSSAATPTWPIRLRDCRHTSRQARTCCTPLAWRTWPSRHLSRPTRQRAGRSRPGHGA